MGLFIKASNFFCTKLTTVYIAIHDTLTTHTDEVMRPKMVRQTEWMLWLTRTNKYFWEVKHSGSDIEDKAKQQRSVKIFWSILISFIQGRDLVHSWKLQALHLGIQRHDTNILVWTMNTKLNTYLKGKFAISFLVS